MEPMKIETWQQPNGLTWTVRIVWGWRAATATSESMGAAYEIAYRQVTEGDTE